VIEAMRLLAAEATQLAQSVPGPVLEGLARELAAADSESWSDHRSRAVSGIGNPQYRSAAASFLDRCKGVPDRMTPQVVSGALLTALAAETARQQAGSIDLVWTGPDGGGSPVRRTEQALLQVINEAKKRLTIVSYAVYNIPRIREALLRAADRDVPINIVIESPDRNEGEKAYSTLVALGNAVAKRCHVYVWPVEKRKKDEAGKHGLLHVKCAAADGKILFLSSANLTVQAFTLNMELGVLVTGGALPAQVEGQFDRLIEKGMLVRA
jgi:phosphatidylserine/phosphatidylglycerophosphate/cardiolipin synthase-like enzyme